MPKIKLPRNSPSIDMTPMVDLAFLLVTFFMLTTKFRPEEAVQVTMPYSVSTTKIPENVTTISIDSAGRVFFDMDGKDARANLFRWIMGDRKIGISDDDVKRFSIIGPFGVSIDKIKEYVEAPEDGRKAMNNASPGIPIDSVSHELADWVRFGWQAATDDWAEKKGPNPPRFAIKADGRAKYKIVKQVIDICQKQNIQHFELITSIKVKQ